MAVAFVVFRFTIARFIFFKTFLSFLDNPKPKAGFFYKEKKVLESGSLVRKLSRSYTNFIISLSINITFERYDNEFFFKRLQGIPGTFAL